MPTAHLTTEIDIAAPPARVWDVLTDLAAWPRWNPFIRQIEGSLIVGTKLTTRMHPTGGRPMTFRPVVTEVTPGVAFAWRGRLMVPGLFDGLHRFRLEAIPGGTRLHHSESFNGILLYTMDVARFRPDFDAMNRALQAVAEGRA
ncbi:MAG: SRPBCC domain-containing protein [Pseudomonadota bacterium]